MNKTFITIGNIQIEIEEDESILCAIRKSKEEIHMETPCNAHKTCGKCKVRVICGNLSPLSKEEKDLLTQSEIKNGIRLACCAKARAPLKPVRIFLLTEAQESHTVLADGRLPDFELEPDIRKQVFEYQTCRQCKSILKNLKKSAYMQSDAFDPVSCSHIDASKKNNSFTAVYYRGRLIGAEPGDTTGQNYGVAVDIGTTTVACSLVDLTDGRILATTSGVNPQTKFGGDVLTRIQYTQDHSNGLLELQNTIVDFLNSLTLELIQNAGIIKETIYCYTIAANATMMHLLLGINPISMAMAPYKPVFTDMQILQVKKIGLIHCSAFALLCCLPAVSAYIGADIVAGVEISGIAAASQTILFIDIGTNGEIVLSQKGQMVSCSCAAGPALEGMNISCGMRAANGAIEHASLKGGMLSLSTIGGTEPAGICGSGVLEIMSELLKAGAIDRTGRIEKHLPDWLERLVVRDNKKPYFVLSTGKNEIRFSQNDIRQVQLAKGAILSGLLTLLNAKGLSASEIDKVVVAGQFGKHLSEESLVGAGILPPDATGKIEYIGNSSLTGAILSLVSSPAIQRIKQLAGQIEYLELATLPGYSRLFMQCMNFDTPTSHP